MAKTRKGDRHSPGYMDAYKKEVYHQMNVRIRKDSGILDALELAHKVTGMPKAEYIRVSIEEKLIADGYMEK